MHTNQNDRRKFTLTCVPLRVLVAAVVGFAWANAYSWDVPTLAAPESARLAGP